MGTKVQHAKGYRHVPVFLRQLREEAGLTQRAMGKALGKPQSYIYNCETANRRVDITEFVMWVRACGADSKKAFERLLKLLG